MRTHRSRGVIAILMLGGTLAATPAGERPGGDGYTADLRIEHCHKLVPNGGNAYFSLHPGRFLRLEGEDDGEFVELEITVLGQTRHIEFEIDGERVKAKARVIEEREWVDGELLEVSRNFFARCSGTNDIFYLGEEVDFYKNGEIVGHAGSWLAGEDGALPGLIMPGLFLLGARYYQEIAPGVALDRAEHVEMGFTMETPACVFEDCVRVVETSPLEPGAESIKIYAPGVGLIADGALELVAWR